MRKGRVSAVYCLLIMWLGFTPPGVLPSESKNDTHYPVSYGNEYLHTDRQQYSITKESTEIKSSDLRPLVSLNEKRFFYKYRLLVNTPFESLPVLLRYKDGRGENSAGLGWDFVYTFQLSNPVPIDIVSPGISYSKTPGKFLYINSETVPVRPDPETGRDVLAGKMEYHGLRYFFLMSGNRTDPLVLPYKIQYSTGDPVIFQYSMNKNRPLLIRIDRGKYGLRFIYANESHGSLARIFLRVKKGDEYINLKHWDFTHETAGIKNERFLRHISIHNTGGDESTLHFCYRTPAGKPGEPNNPVDWYSPVAVPGCVWKFRKGESQPLPGDKTIKNNPGLRFIDLNCDSHLDLVETGSFSPDSWIWDPKTRSWEYFGDTYKPDRPSVFSWKQPTGSHYTGLWKAFKDRRFNTTKHRSIITAYYKPTKDGKDLEYHYHVSFPRVFLDKLDPDAGGNVWERVVDERLKLPVPLQYEGRRPWPLHIPGISAEEGYRNQGAQFVRFTKDGCINLLYVGKRYRDAVTGKILPEGIVTHRDTCNCREWYEEEWDIPGTNGKKRKVKVDLCQGFWKAKKEYWTDYRGSNESFWERKDLDPEGRALDCYILPWQENNPDYYHHYLGFQNVKFVSLDPNKTFMVVHNPVPVSPGGAVKDIYRLRGEKWIKLEKDSGYYPPGDVLNKKECMFVDIDNDGRDDLIIPHGYDGNVFINMGKGVKPRWKCCPAFVIPRQCNLADGGAQWVDLDNDGDQDLIYGDGGSGLTGGVFINQSTSTCNSRAHGMSVFTDENGKQRPVKR